MLKNIIYAKKLLLPTREANSLQSLNMAAAFGKQAAERQAGFSFFPGLRFSMAERDNALEKLGLSKEQFTSWHWQAGKHRGLYGLKFRWQLLRALRKNKSALVYARDLSEAGFLAKLMGASPRKAGVDQLFIFEMHESLFELHKSKPGRDWQKTFQREAAILRAVDGLVVVNPSLAESVKRHFAYEGPVLAAPNGFNAALFNKIDLFSPEHPWPQNGETVRLQYTGSFKAGKGMPELLQAMALLPENFCLDVFGAAKGAEMQELERLKNNVPNAEKRIVFHGFVPQTQLREACANLHISVIPQQSEHDYFCPIKLNESLALGLPVLASPLKIFSSTRHLAHHAPDKSPQGLAQGIQELAANPQLAEKLREQGLREAAGHTWENRAGRILDFADNISRKR